MPRPVSIQLANPPGLFQAQEEAGEYYLTADETSRMLCQYAEPFSALVRFSALDDLPWFGVLHDRATVENRWEAVLLPGCPEPVWHLGRVEIVEVF
jgi:hypothetical protein